jgi:hypothetical protein
MPVTKRVEETRQTHSCTDNNNSNSSSVPSLGYNSNNNSKAWICKPFIRKIPVQVRETRRSTLHGRAQTHILGWEVLFSIFICHPLAYFSSFRFIGLRRCVNERCHIKNCDWNSSCVARNPLQNKCKKFAPFYSTESVYYNEFRRSRDSVVGIATGYGLDDRDGRSLSPGRVKNFLFSTSSKSVLWSTRPPIQWVPGALSLSVKRPGREADHSPATIADVKKTWIYTSTPPYAFMA